VYLFIFCYSIGVSMTIIERVKELRAYVGISDSELSAIETVMALYPMRITDYYASLIDWSDHTCPIRLQSVPSVEELDSSFGTDDPLCEGNNSVVPGVIRVYPDRVAVIVTNQCPVYCRHCLRRRFRRNDEDDLRGNRFHDVISYIQNDQTIRDVLLTGGDPLMWNDDDLNHLLGRIRAINHVEIIRIGTRAPCTWPERITPSFVDMVASHHPVWISTQFNHPREITPASIWALEMLIGRGIPVNNQSVLLRGINDSIEVMTDLVRQLVKSRVRPYYLYQAQALRGTRHFVVPIEKGLEIIRGLRGWTTGFAVPQYVLDTPGGKIPLNSQYIIGRKGDYIEMVNYQGETWREFNPIID
jgi:lysine 2,3-aminomutase